MNLVLDASVTLCWCFREQRNPTSDKTFAILQSNAAALVPALWWYEIRNSAAMGVRRKRIDRLEVATFLKRLELMVIKIAELPDSNTVLDLALRHNLTFYDAAYLELAQREDLALATLDHALVRAATAEGVSLIAA